MFFSKLSDKFTKRFAWIFAALSFLGFLDALYLTFEHYTGAPLPCVIFTGCDTVTNSAYATIGPISVALLGALYYLIILILTIAYLENGSRRSLAVATLITPIGFLASLYFLYLQIFVIGALCLYCIISATDSTILVIVSLTLILLLTKTKVSQPPPS